MESSLSELPLFREDKVARPLAQVLEQTSPSSQSNNSYKTKEYFSLTQSLSELFPEQERDERELKKAKEILGADAVEFSNDQLRDLITEIQFLTETWLDDFERRTFKGLTLNELLHEKGGL